MPASPNLFMFQFLILLFGPPILYVIADAARTAHPKGAVCAAVASIFLAVTTMFLMVPITAELLMERAALPHSRHPGGLIVIMVLWLAANLCLVAANGRLLYALTTIGPPKGGDGDRTA